MTLEWHDDPDALFAEACTDEWVAARASQIATTLRVPLQTAEEGLQEAAAKLRAEWERHTCPELSRLLAQGKYDSPVDGLRAFLYPRAVRRTIDEQRKDGRRRRTEREYAAQSLQRGGVTDRERRFEEHGQEGAVAPSTRPRPRPLLLDPQDAVSDIPSPDAPASEHIAYAQACKRDKSWPPGAESLAALSEPELIVLLLYQQRGDTDEDIAAALSTLAERPVETVEVLAAIWRVIHRESADQQFSTAQLLPPELVDERRPVWREWLTRNGNGHLHAGEVEFLASKLAGQTYHHAGQHVLARGLQLPVSTDPSDRRRLTESLKTRFGRALERHAWLADKLDTDIVL